MTGLQVSQQDIAAPNLAKNGADLWLAAIVTWLTLQVGPLMITSFPPGIGMATARFLVVILNAGVWVNPAFAETAPMFSIYDSSTPIYSIQGIQNLAI